MVFPDSLTKLAQRSISGDSLAIAQLLTALRPNIYALACRFLMSSADAEDATQDILLKILERLAQYEFNSKLETWVYRVACNHLIDLQRRRQSNGLSFESFGEDLVEGLVDEHSESAYDERLLAEIRIACTLAILQCLKPAQRMAYILGEIMNLNHTEGALALGISTSTYRQRLSRARSTLVDFVNNHCGLANKQNPCRCHKRADSAISKGRIDPQCLQLAPPHKVAEHFPEVLRNIRFLEGAQRVAALYQTAQLAMPKYEFNAWLDAVVSEYSE